MKPDDEATHDPSGSVIMTVQAFIALRRVLDPTQAEREALALVRLITGT